MKKILALVCFLIAAVACTPGPSGNKDTTANANKAAEAKPPSESEIVAIEKSGWDLIKKKDVDGLGKLLTDDFIEIEDEGVYDKAASLASLKDYDLTDITFSNWKMLTIDKDAVILTYDVTTKATSKGQPIPAGPYHAAAGYVNRAGKWLGISFQQTLSQKAPPPPPAASQSPKTTGSPAGSPGETGPDPVANEKIVWDALKNRNYDAFAALLAPESIEIEADGVHDKASSVKGVSMFDASKYQLSEWKTVKFDNDASLVTYLVSSTGANPEQERHTSIWVNRNGKWLALLHQGTPITKPEVKK